MEYYVEIKFKDKRVCGLFPNSKKEIAQYLRRNYPRYKLIKLAQIDCKK